MNLQDYAPRALAFASMQPTEREDLFHGVLGIASELAEIITCWDSAEFDDTNHIEELGDYMWFMNLISSVTDIELKVQPLEQSPPRCLTLLTRGTGAIADLVKSEMIYGKERDFEDLIIAIDVCVSSIAVLAAYSNKSMDDILEANIAKLTARYGEKFTLEGALNRNKEAEREAINGG